MQKIRKYEDSEDLPEIESIRKELEGTYVSWASFKKQIGERLYWNREIERWDNEHPRWMYTFIESYPYFERWAAGLHPGDIQAGITTYVKNSDNGEFESSIILFRLMFCGVLALEIREPIEKKNIYNRDAEKVYLQVACWMRSNDSKKTIKKIISDQPEKGRGHIGSEEMNENERTVGIIY